MLRRAILLGVVFATTLLLLFLQNKVLVGSQELQAALVPVTDQPLAYELVFKDLAGNRVDISALEQAEVRKRLAGNEERRPIRAKVAHEAVGSRGMVLAAEDQQAANELRDRLQGRPFKRANPTRDLFHLTKGIDIQGGVEFVCRLLDDDGNQKPADDETVAILRSRLDERGLTEPQVTRLSNNDVQVVIPGGTNADAARTRKVLETTGKLEFREVLPVGLPGQDGRDEGAITLTDPLAKDSPVRQKPNGGWDWARENLPTFNNGRGLPVNRGDIVVPEKAEPGALPHRFLRLGPAILMGKDVADSNRTIHEGRLAVSIQFTALGAGKNEDFTRAIKDRGDRKAGTGRMAIVFDGVVQSDPTVIEPSRDSCVISGRFTDEEIDSLKTVLKGGSLSVKPVVLSQRTVGASLGAQAVSRSMVTMGLTFVAIGIFMVLYYRRLGAVASTCLMIAGLLTWGILSTFGATLTLPGLAGLVLSIGMAVDTNILIFERIREELRDDKGPKAAIAAGYDRAFATILDAHVTTLLAAGILYAVGDGAVKGFGLTLIIGLLVNMFTGVFVGRMFTDWLCTSERSLRMSEWFKPSTWLLPYVAWRKIGYGLSIVTGVLSLAWFAFGHVVTKETFDRNFDIDFTGGNMAQVVFRDAFTMDEVRSKVAAAHSASSAAIDLLTPGELQLQPYYANLGQTGASREWVFRARDDAGTGLEHQRNRLDRERADLEHSLVKMREAAPEGAGNTPEIKAQAELVVAKAREVEAKTRLVSERAEEFKRQIAAVFAGHIDPEGSEVVAAVWNGPSLTVTLATLEPVPSHALAEIGERVSRHPSLTGVISAVAEARSEGPGLTVTATFRDSPAPRVGEATDEAVAQRLATLLGTTLVNQVEQPVTGAVLNGQVDLALRVCTATANAAATSKVTVAKSYPATQHFSGQVAGRMKTGALIAVLLSLVGILAYVAMRFEFRFGIGAVVALFHDVLLTVGLISVLGIRIDLTVIAALLTIIGFSINDTIVVFDRIRENLLKLAKPLAETIDLSVAQTMPRTILTTGTVLISVLMLWLFGGDSLYAFTSTLLIGLVAGTYSSVFVAAPLLVTFGARMEPPKVVDAEVMKDDEVAR